MRKLVLALFWVCPAFTLFTYSQVKVPLSQEMIINFSTQGDASLLVDEQQISGDPKNGIGGTPSTIYTGGYNSLYYPLQVIIDLGSTHQVSEIYLFDANNADTLSIYTGSPLGWQNPSKIYLGFYNSWRSVPLNTTTRYIMLEFPTRKANIAEIILYGQPNFQAKPIPPKITHTLPKMETLIGINALHNQPVDKLRCVGSVREYHPWQWDEGNGNSSYPGYPNNEFAWSPSWVSGSGWGWDFDQKYSEFKNANLDLSPCLQQTALFMLDSSKNVDQKPISPNDDPEDPASYIEHSRYLFQFTARYGSSQVPASQLMLRNGQPQVSGLGLIKYVENWNEPDKWWRGRDGHFNPYEMAAMCSADYDGHEGALGSGHGAKNADPNIKFVMGGLTILGLDYIKSMKLWCDLHRTSGFPADVLNFHHYSNTSGGQSTNLRQGISPEDDNLKQKLVEIVDYRDRYLPGKEIWVSEFGYDTNPNSTQGVPAIGNNDGYEVQGQWLLRSYLEMAAAGIDRAHLYFFADLNAPNPNKFNSSGIVNENWFGYQPKKSWYYVYAFKKALTDYRFVSEIPSQNPDVNVYEFYNENSATTIYAAWCTTSEDKKVNNFELNIGNALGATLLTLSPTDTVAIESQLSTSASNSVFINLSERPVFVRAVSSNSTNCIQAKAKPFKQLQLDKNGTATISPADIDNGSLSNCGALSLSVSQNQFDCSNANWGFYQEVVSDSSWMQSTVVESKTSQSFPWPGVSGNLPPTNTFTTPVTIGQPKKYHSIDNVTGSQVVTSGSLVTFYRKTFTLPSFTNADFFAEITVDDDIEIYLNGSLLAREGSHHNSSSSLPPHRVHSDSAASVNIPHEAFDYSNPNGKALLQPGLNEIILAVRNKRSSDNGGFSFRMGVGNPSAGGNKVILTATDNITQAMDTASTVVQLIDNLPPSFNLVTQPQVYLSSNGTASVDLLDLQHSVIDNCQVTSISHSPKLVKFEDLLDTAIVEIVSDDTWRKSTFSDSKYAFSYPWNGMPTLPDSSTYTLKPQLGQPYSYEGIYPIPGTTVISTTEHITFFKKQFILNLNSIDESWIELSVDDDAEVYINGSLLVREGSFSGSNRAAPAHKIYYDATSSQNGYQGGDSFDFVHSNNLTSLLNPSGKNEIILAIRNGGKNNVGGFSFKLSIPLAEKNHIPAVITASDKFGNVNTAYTSIEVKDTIPPTLVTSSPLLSPNNTGLVTLNTGMFDNGSYDNTTIESLSIFPSTIVCGGPSNALFSATDYFGNTSSTSLNLSLDTSLCPIGMGGSKKSGAPRVDKSKQNSSNISEASWDFKIYPLPASDNLTITLHDATIEENVSLQIWDLSGKLLLNEQHTANSNTFSSEVNVSQLAAGKYFLKIKHREEMKTKKLVIE